jgi:hypothetical protein
VLEEARLRLAGLADMAVDVEGTLARVDAVLGR